MTAYSSPVSCRARSLAISHMAWLELQHPRRVEWRGLDRETYTDCFKTLCLDITSPYARTHITENSIATTNTLHEDTAKADVHK